LSRHDGVGYEEAVNLFEGPEKQASELVQSIRSHEHITLAAGEGSLVLLHEGAVPEHPDRAALIIGRTVDRLLRRGMILAAVLVWRDHSPETWMEKDVERQLLGKLAEGWQERRLWSRSTPPVVLHAPANVRITAREQLFTCQLLGSIGQGTFPEAALEASVRALFAELLGLVEEETPSIEQAQRKRELTALIDLEALRAGGETGRWVAYLASMDGLVADGLITKAQQQTFLKTWASIRRVFSTVRRPGIGRTDENRLYLNWSFAERPSVTFSVDICPDGRLDWFYREVTRNEIRGTEDAPQSELPADAIRLLAPFAT
jgi:hypothetical protein